MMLLIVLSIWFNVGFAMIAYLNVKYPQGEYPDSGKILELIEMALTFPVVMFTIAMEEIFGG